MTTKYEAMREALESIAQYIPKTTASEGGASAYSGNVRAADKVRAALAMPDDPTPEESSVVVPDGWKLVPITMTDEMWVAAKSAGTIDKSWPAALAAAPKLCGIETDPRAPGMIGDEL